MSNCEHELPTHLCMKCGNNAPPVGLGSEATPPLCDCQFDDLACGNEQCEGFGDGSLDSTVNEEQAVLEAVAGTMQMELDGAQDLTIRQVAWHRNGIYGTGFYAILFHDPENGEMLGILHDADTYCSVVQVDKLSDPDIGVTFTENSWRGVYYEPALRAAADEWDRLRDITWSVESPEVQAALG